MESEGNTIVLDTSMHGIDMVRQCSSKNTIVYATPTQKYSTQSFKSLGMARIQWRHTLTAVWKMTGLDQPTDNYSKE